MWADVLNMSDKLLDALSRIGASVMEFLENETLNSILNSLVVGPQVSTIEILFGSAISIVLLVGVYNWISRVIIPG